MTKHNIEQNIFQHLKRLTIMAFNEIIALGLIWLPLVLHDVYEFRLYTTKQHLTEYTKLEKNHVIQNPDTLQKETANSMFI